jgi:hypothetical protein
MSTLRSLRLLGSVETGTTLGPALNTFLEDSGRLSEFHVLLSMRGQARRMASSTTTMTAIIASPIATNAVFADTDINNPMTAKAIVANQTAITTVSNDPVTLNIVGTNPVSWDLFKGSPWYESRIKEVVANLAGLTPTAYSSASDIVTNAGAVSDVVSYPRAMAAVIASPDTTTAMVGNSAAMSILVADTVATGLVAANAVAMSSVAASSVAMDIIADSAVAMPVVAASAGAVQAIGASATAWPKFFGSPSFGNSDKAIMLNLVGLDPSAYGSFDAVIADNTALAAVAGNANAVATLASNSAAFSALAESPNVGTVLASATAMGVIGPDATSMTALINSSAAMVPLFASSVAKGYMFTDALVDLIASKSSIVDYMTANGVKTTPASLRSGTTVVSQPFDGIPSKVMFLSMRANNIGAIAATFIFGGSTAAGTGSTASIGLKGTVIESRVSGYIDPTWGVSGIAATAAAWPEVTYFDMS